MEALLFVVRVGSNYVVMTNLTTSFGMETTVGQPEYVLVSGRIVKITSRSGCPPKSELITVDIKISIGDSRSEASPVVLGRCTLFIGFVNLNMSQVLHEGLLRSKKTYKLRIKIKARPSRCCSVRYSRMAFRHRRFLSDTNARGRQKLMVRGRPTEYPRLPNTCRRKVKSRQGTEPGKDSVRDLRIYIL